MASGIQRPLRGSRISSFYPIKNLPSLSSLDSAFQLQEYISLLIRLDVHDVDAIVTLPGSTKDTGKAKGSEERTEGKEGEKKSDITVDEACWIYEQLRRLAQDLTHPLITTLQQECTRASCPEMKAGEWLYLCVAHGNDGAMEQCCAIDYILHTLDSATALLNSPRAFPSRLQIPQTSHRHFSSLARRLGRIFAHAYFHHREAFEQAEVESSLHARFLSLTAKFDLVPPEFLVIPSSSFSGHDESDREVEPPRLLAAAVDPQADRERRGEHRPSPAATQRHLGVQPPGQYSPYSRTKSVSPPGPLVDGSESPRKYGRNRTDTMIFSEAEASLVVDGLANSGNNGDNPVDELDVPKTARPEPERVLEPIDNSDKEPIPSSIPEIIDTPVVSTVALSEPTVAAETVESEAKPAEEKTKEEGASVVGEERATEEASSVEKPLSAPVIVEPTRTTTPIEPPPSAAIPAASSEAKEAHAPSATESKPTNGSPAAADEEEEKKVDVPVVAAADEEKPLTTAPEEKAVFPVVEAETSGLEGKVDTELDAVPSQSSEPDASVPSAPAKAEAPPATSEIVPATTTSEPDSAPVAVAVESVPSTKEEDVSGVTIAPSVVEPEQSAEPGVGKAAEPESVEAGELEVVEAGEPEVVKAEQEDVSS